MKKDSNPIYFKYMILHVISKNSDGNTENRFYRLINRDSTLYCSASYIIPNLQDSYDEDTEFSMAFEADEQFECDDETAEAYDKWLNRLILE